MYDYGEAIRKKSIEKDLAFIHNEIIAQQLDGKYCKFCKDLDAITVMDKKGSDYIKYWVDSYKNESQENIERIKKAAEDKLKNGLISREKMIQLVENCKDTTSDKPEALKRLRF